MSTVAQRRPFSVRLYLLIVFALSWPFQIAYPFLGEVYRPILLVSMVMAGVGTFICGRFVFRDGFARAGWSWGRPRHYVMALGLALFLWLLPSVLERLFGIYVATTRTTLAGFLVVLLPSFALTILPAFGEEFSWRGYLLPRLFERYSTKRALLLHGFVTWVWHLPVVVLMGMEQGADPLVGIPVVMTISLVPTVMHAVVFAYFWSSSGSLAVVTFYHVAFDEIRDSLEGTIGLGPLGLNFQMVGLTVFGLMALFKAGWHGKNSSAG